MATIKLLVVGGGGGGGNLSAGGGSGGQVIYDTVYPITPQSYTVTVGTGGLGSTNTNLPGDDGIHSIFDSFVSIGGGGGGSQLAASSQGSYGGGGSYNNTGVYGLGANGLVVNKGGDGTNAPNQGAGGGGGVNGNGQNGSTTNGGNGGTGTNNTISGTSVGYGGGGGGAIVTGVGSGNNAGLGQQGGGDGGQYQTPQQLATNGIANTGGGGGGGGNGADPGGNGADGTVIISYPTGTLNATGGTITTSGGNTIHTFTSTGTWTVALVPGLMYLDATSQGGGNPSNGYPVSWSHTCSGTDRLLVVGTTHANGASSLTGITYNGVAMTMIAQQAGLANLINSALFYMINPPSGTHTITISGGGGSPTIWGAAASFTNADQTTQPDSFAQGQAQSGNPSLSTTVVANNSMLVAIYNLLDNNAPNAGTGMTQLQIYQGSQSGIFGYSGLGVGTGSQSMTVNAAGTDWYAGIMASFKPAAGGATTQNGAFLMNFL